MTSTLVLTKPSSEQIKEWWRWAASFADSNSPFRSGIGRDFDNVRQPRYDFFCLACTAGNGGRDRTQRSLRGAMQKGVPVLVPVFVGTSHQRVSTGASVAPAGLIDEARKEVGTLDSDGNPSGPAVVLNIDGVPYSAFYVEQDINDVVFVRDNSFGLSEGRYYLATAGYWILITPPFRKIIFGGRGGRISNSNSDAFETEVTYDITP